MKNMDQDLIAIRYLFETEPERSWKPQEIAATLGFRGKRLPVLQLAMATLTREGALVEIRPGVFGLGKAADLITGKLTLVRSGVGFVTDNTTGESVRIESDDVGTALPGDLVTVRKMDSGEKKRLGRIIRIVERGGRDIVGTLSTTGRFLYVIPFDPIYRRDIVVPDAHGAKEGDRVVVRFQNWVNKHVAPEGEIVDVIGPADHPSLDTEVVVRQYNLPREFPAEVMRDAETVAERLKQPGERLDLRGNTFILTIDPATAKDFDDALSLVHDAQGRRVLGVHIADVSHFVRPGSPLDAEAAERTTSVYLVDKVIPMLPVQLSNGVCSLRPNEDRLCFSAFLTFDADGRVCGRRFAKTLIRSNLRLDYEQALEVIENRPVAGLSIPAEAVALIHETHQLAQQLRKTRMRDGALDLEVPECEILLDADAKMTGVKLRPNDVSHQMIEECMVAANEAVATELKLRGIPILSRLHEPPDPLKIDELSAALLQLGFHPGDLTDPRNLTRFLGSTIDHPLRDNAHTLVLRSMKRAIYSAELAGHFGLAKRFYSHFTSPIRRYPDLVLHRQLAEHLAKSPKRSGIDLGYLKVTAAKCTEREQQADDASRALIEIKKYRFLQQQIDDRKLIAYEAVISRVTNFGLFVDVTPLQVGGLIHISSISQEFVRFDRETESLSAEGQSFKLGGKVKVVVARVDFTQRRADFTLVRDLAAAPDKAGAGVRKSARPKTPRGDGGRSDRGGSGSQPRGQDGRQSAQPRRQDGPRPAAQPRGQGPGAAKKTTEGAPASPREGKRRGDPRSDFTTQRQRSR
jgi:ribonuclease R